jgi:hypothetical protein
VYNKIYFERTTAAVFVIRFSDVKPIWYGTVHLTFQRIKKPLSDVPSQTCPKLRIPDIKAEVWSE